MTQFLIYDPLTPSSSTISRNNCDIYDSCYIVTNIYQNVMLIREQVEKLRFRTEIIWLEGIHIHINTIQELNILVSGPADIKCYF